MDAKNAKGGKESNLKDAKAGGKGGKQQSPSPPPPAKKGGRK